MNFDLKTPCKDCPFRPSVQFSLAPGRRRDIAESLKDDHNVFPCHKTAHRHKKNRQHCAGAMLLLFKEGRTNIMMRIAMMRGKLNPEQMKPTDDIYPTLDDFAKDEH